MTSDPDRTVLTMKYFVAIALAAACAGAVLPAAAQEGAPRHGHHPGERVRHEARRPFESLVRHRAELGLTDAQVEALREIGRRLEERNHPLRERLREEHQRFRAERRAEIERLSPEERRAALHRLRGDGPRGIPEAMRPLVEQMQKNVAEARAEAGRVLSAEQKARARELLREHRGRRWRHGRHQHADTSRSGHP